MLKSSENEIDDILKKKIYYIKKHIKLTKLIRDESFMNMAIENLQHLLIEEKINEANLMKMEAINHIDSVDNGINKDCYNLKKLII